MKTAGFDWAPFPLMMPALKTRYLITVVTPEFGLLVDVAYWDGKRFHCPEGSECVKAWRPLPRPYRGEEK